MQLGPSPYQSSLSPAQAAGEQLDRAKPVHGFIIAIDQLGDAARTVWPEAAAIEPGKDEEYPRRLVERLRSKLAN